MIFPKINSWLTLIVYERVYGGGVGTSSRCQRQESHNLLPRLEKYMFNKADDIEKKQPVTPPPPASGLTSALSQRYKFK